MSIENFEHLWERSEKIAEEYYGQKDWDIIDSISEIRRLMLFLHAQKSELEIKELMGLLLFNLTFLSKKLNIDTYHALKDQLEDIKIDMLESSVDNNE